MDNNKNKLDSKSKQLVVGIFAVLILLTFSAVMIIAAENFAQGSKPVTTGGAPLADVNNPTSTTQQDNVNGQTGIHTDIFTTTETQVVTETQTQQVPISVEGLEEFTKTGDNMISDSPNNEFIRLIVKEKGANAETLVAIYAVPDLGNNFVLEFDDKRDENGNIIRSPKTLKKIYHINKERNITVATGKPTGNEGVDYGTSLMTYYLVTDVVMPEFPEYFTDVG